jgi:hypothetical protein
MSAGVRHFPHHPAGLKGRVVDKRAAGDVRLSPAGQLTPGDIAQQGGLFALPTPGGGGGGGGGHASDKSSTGDEYDDAVRG